MSTYLQKQLQTRMEAKNLSINALEKQAGVKRSAARNIILGFSKKPSADVLKALADVLGCTLDDLIDPTKNEVNSSFYKSPPVTSNNLWNEKLFLDAIKTVSKTLSERKIDARLEQVNSLALEAYKYSLSKQSDRVDRDFVNWLIGRIG